APENRYRLLYGDADARAVELDTAALSELLQSGFPTAAAALDEQLPLADTVEDAPRWRELWTHPAALVSIIALLVVILGLGLYHAARRIDETSSTSSRAGDEKT